MSSDVWSVISRHDPARWRQTLSHRSKDDLPFDPLQIPIDASLLFDSTVYIDQLKGQLPAAIVNLIASRTIFHAAPALAELAVIIGALDPADRRTRSALEPIVETLTRISTRRIITPTYEVWLEASVIAGILSRTQGIPKQDRRRFLEPISKSSEEDNEAGELDKAEEVLGVVLPADEDAALPLNPGEEALDEPASHVAA